MKKKTIIIVTSVLAILVCVAIAVGTTVAILSSESSPINISFASGKVKVEANVTDVTLYSAHAASNGSLVDENGKTYNYKQCSGDKFANGGSAKFDEDKTLVLSGLSAGDKVEFKVELSNTSTVRVVYTMGVALLDQETSRLFDALEMSVAVKEASGYRQLDIPTHDSKSIVSEQVPLAVEDGVAENGEVLVSVGLPITATDVQHTQIKVRCYVFAIQDTTAIHGIAIIEGDDGVINSYMTLQEAVNAAQPDETIYLVSGDDQPAGTVLINKSVNICSYNDELQEFTDLRFVVTNENAAVKISDIAFAGNSYVDISTCYSLTLTNCYVDVTPEKVSDPSTMQPMEKSAFVVSTRNQLLPTKVDINNNVFAASDSTPADFVPVYLNSLVADGSVISDNVFGSQAHALPDNAIQIATVANLATINIGKNTFYAATAISLQSESGVQYSAVLQQNSIVASGTPALVKVVGVSSVDVFDAGSVANGAAVTHANFDMAQNTRFCGINVEFFQNTLGNSVKVQSGVFKLSASYTKEQFLENYTVSGSNATVSFVE